LRVKLRAKNGTQEKKGDLDQRMKKSLKKADAHAKKDAK